MPVPGANGEVDVIWIGERTRPRVLVLVPRQNMLPGKKFAIAGRDRQHARRVRSPESATAQEDARPYRLNESIVQTDFRSIVSARCTPEL